MPFELINSAFFAAVEPLVNRVFSLDPTTRKKLQNLDEKVIEVCADNFPFRVFLLFLDGHLSLSGVYGGDTDCVIRGSTADLLPLLFAKDKRAAFRDGRVQISGDTETAQQLQDLILNLRVDWEYEFSKVFGDIPTQLFSDNLKNLRDFLTQAEQNLSRDLDEYLHEEARLVPGIEELEGFYQSIDALRLRTDRLDARLGQLESNFEKK